MTDREQDRTSLIDLSIVSFNSSKWIGAFITSLIGQHYPTARMNLFIRDHGSTDGTLASWHDAEDKLVSLFNSVRIVTGANSGFGAGHNHNAAQGTAPYLLVTNVDLEFEPDAIVRAVATAQSDAAQSASWEFRQKPFEHPKYYDPVTLETRWSSSACILFRRTAFEQVRGYDERIFMYGEDVELSYRLRDHGYVLRYCPKAVCWHYSYEQGAQIKPLQFFGSTLANVYIRMRYGSALQVLSGLALYCSLWLRSPALPHKWTGLWKNGVQIARNAAYFLTSRKRSAAKFPFRRWDYEFTRAGAFYSCDHKIAMAPPLVSVIMRTYKGRLPWLREATTSILNQTYPNIELVIVEDGSEEAREFAQQLQSKGELTSVVYSSIAKLGRCHAGNAGLAAATGSFMAFLDDDDLYFADHLEVMLAALARHPDCGGVYGLSFQVPTAVASLEPLHYQEKRFDLIYRQKFSRAILWHHNYIPIQAAVFRRTLYDEYGGFDQDLENLEDWNLWTRYCLRDDFLMVDKLTSLYRVPHPARHYVSRQKSLNAYYVSAVERQKDMMVTVSVAELMQISKELSANVNAVVIPYVRIRNLIIRNRMLNIFYYIAVRIVNVMRSRFS